MKLREVIELCSDYKWINLYINGHYEGVFMPPYISHYYNKTIMNSKVTSVDTIDDERTLVIKTKTDIEKEESNSTGMKLLIGKRQSGKSIRLIEKAAKKKNISIF